MEINNQELAFILYNNRSKNLVNKFIPDGFNPYRLTNIENIFEKSKNIFSVNKMVEIPLSDLKLEFIDIDFDKSEVQSLTNKFNNIKGRFNQREIEFLKKRGIDKNIIEKWGLTGLSNFTDKRELEIIGASVHPLISNIIIDGIEGGGIVFPLYQEGILQNCAIRKISLENTDKVSLKYSLSCPDIPIWKSDDIRPGDEIWLTEGLFDMFALDNIGYKSVSCSSAMWSGIQLYQIVILKPGKINIFSDNDEVGLKTSAILKHFFKSYSIDCQVFKSKFAKDSSEHFFELGKSISDIEEIDFNNIKIKSDNSFNFLNHLKNRKY